MKISFEWKFCMTSNRAHGKSVQLSVCSSDTITASIIPSSDPPPLSWLPSFECHCQSSAVLQCNYLSNSDYHRTNIRQLYRTDMYAKTESEVSIQTKMGETSEKQNLGSLKKVTSLISHWLMFDKLCAGQRMSEWPDQAGEAPVPVRLMPLPLHHRAGHRDGVQSKQWTPMQTLVINTQFYIRRGQEYCLPRKIQAIIRDLITSPITQDGSIYLTEINQMFFRRFAWQRYNLKKMFNAWN